MMGSLGHAYAVLGNREKALGMPADLRELARRRYVAPFDSAVIYTGLSDNKLALEWLGKALDDRSWELTLLKADPRFDSLRSDPRFSSLLRRMGLMP